MVLLNIYSLSHFLIWFFSGRYLLRNHAIFLILSIGWEVLELFLPFEFAIETWDNKIADILVNCIGYSLGHLLWNRMSVDKSD